MAGTVSETISQRYQEIQALSPTDESTTAIPQEPTISISSFLSISLFIFFFVVVFLGFLPLVVGRFRDFKRFQMALIVALIGGALPLTLGLVLHRTGILTQATVVETPRNVVILNVTSDSFRVQWTTSGLQYGALRFGTQPYRSSLIHTQLEVGGLSRSTEHDVLVKNLSPETDYYFEILSGAHWYDSEGVFLHVKTLPH